ncbi:PIG-L family deacetylase [Hyphomicrobium sp. ghe19]|uniref:PIG-L deacetylase family protein n=1 Tax=Hyphomicrobium sp. ghe19 TaxID=2682968 RepID=UPI0030D12514
MPRRVLVLAPHADDAEFGIGAYIARATDAGWHVTVVIGATGNYHRGSVWIDGGSREGEARKALAHLGVTDVRFEKWFNENLALAADYTRIVTGIENLVSGYDEVYVCLPSFNQDHRVLHDAFLTATRPGRTTANLYAYEYPGNCWGPPLPTCGKKYLVCSPVHAVRKLEALMMHKSQFDGRFVCVGPQAAKSLLDQRGSEVGPDPAELVYVMREFG